MLVLIACLFFWMLCGHAIADYSFQSDTMAIGKNRHLEKGCYRSVPWYYWMAAHALIHGGTTGLLSGWIVLGVIETVIHFIVDCAKCDKVINVHVDQAIHVGCKAVYAYVAANLMLGMW